MLDFARVYHCFSSSTIDRFTWKFPRFSQLAVFLRSGKKGKRGLELFAGRVANRKLRCPVGQPVKVQWEMHHTWYFVTFTASTYSSQRTRFARKPRNKRTFSHQQLFPRRVRHPPTSSDARKWGKPPEETHECQHKTKYRAAQKTVHRWTRTLRRHSDTPNVLLALYSLSSLNRVPVLTQNTKEREQTNSPMFSIRPLAVIALNRVFHPNMYKKNKRYQKK